jgi:23S rRNA pseudouridine955/2504/2580 synthase/23S rRNA pseudouridine1911/1915/1917 synthase
MKKLPFEILWEDADYVAINKPAGMLTLPDRFDPSIPNLYRLLKEQYGDIFVVHRIDKQTSGVIAFAKNAEAHRQLNERFENHAIEKKYLTLVQGRVADDEGRIDLPIGENSAKAGTMRIDTPHGKPSVTGFKVLERFLEYTLVEAQPLSGRTHQIRVHFKAIGHPLAVDEIYGSSEGIKLSSIKKNYKSKPGIEERPLISRLTLHAKSLRFQNFSDQKMVTMEAPLPKDFDSVLRQLRRSNPAPAL